MAVRVNNESAVLLAGARAQTAPRRAGALYRSYQGNSERAFWHGVPASAGGTGPRGQSHDSSPEELPSVLPAEAGTPCQNARPGLPSLSDFGFRPSFGFRISDFGFFLPLLLCLFWFSASAWAAGSVTARVDREAVPVGETFTLSLIFEGVQPAGTPTLPALPNLNLVSTGESSEFSIGGGRTVSRKTINFTLAPTQAGEIAIPALQIQISGQVFTTQPLKVRALPAGAAGANPQAALTNLAFLRLITPKEEVFLGEAFPVELQL